MTESAYDDPSEIDRQALAGRHRAVIGGAWEEIGRLQLEFLIARGLAAHHVLLDIGCGPLRAGVRIIPYLDPGNYWGIDKNETLLRIGYDLELRRCGVQDRQPRDQLLCLADFAFDRIDARFDVAIAHSLFTHLSLNRIRRCLARLAPSLRTDARLYATIFEVEPGQDREAAIVHPPEGVVSHSDHAFYHYDRRDLGFVVEDLPLTVEHIGDWGHPRGQHMVAFRKL